MAHSTGAAARLVLFDIDGTILLSGGAGLSAIAAATDELYGRPFELKDVTTAGRLDPLIWAEAAAINGVDADAGHDAFRDAYARHLAAAFAGPARAELLPGVVELVDALEREASIVLGLLTGNYEETGRLKVTHAGIDPDRFTITAWGDDGGHRRDLPAVAMARYATEHGEIAPEEVVIIGDTPHDIDCAQHHGCRVLAVATGQFGPDALCDADWTIDDLGCTDDVARWITSSPR